MAGEIAAAGISGGSSVLGGIISGIFGARQQKKANEFNLKLNQMNNEFNERMAKEQRAWQEEMWNKQNAYNDPSAMMSRYRAAGLNPGLMMSGGSGVGAAQSAGSGSSASAANAIPMQPASLGDGISKSFMGLGQLLSAIPLQREQVKNLAIQNKYADSKINAEIENIIEDTRNKRAKSIWQETQNLRAEEYFDSQIKQMRENIALTNQQMVNETAKNTLMQIEIKKGNTYLQYYDENLRNVLALQAARIRETEKNIEVADAKIAKLAAETAYTWAAEHGQRIDNNVLERTKETLISSTNAANEDTYNFYNSVYTDTDGRKWKPWQMRSRSMGLGNLSLKTGIENASWYKQQQRNYIAQGYLNWLTDAGGLVMTRGMAKGRKPSASTHPRYDWNNSNSSDWYNHYYRY